MNRSAFFAGLLSISVILLASCSASKPNAHLIINNESANAIPIELLIRDKEDGKIRRNIKQAVKPGLQQVALGKLAKGSYELEVKANEGVIQQHYPLALDTDRWILLTYMHGDSIQLQKRYGYVDACKMKKLDGKYAGIDLYVENRRPPNL